MPETRSDFGGIYGSRMVDPDQARCLQYKNTKRLFRKLSRECVKTMDNDFYRSLDNLLTRDSNKFWQRVRARRRCHVPSSLTAEQFVKHYSSIMTDGNELSTTQRSINDDVKSNYSKLQDQIIPHFISVEHIHHVISRLKRNSSPGVDGISAEFLIHGRSSCLTYDIVHDVFLTGVMVPLLKKPTLDPSLPSNYRPITISSVFTKLFEMLILPDEEGLPLSPNQYGFRNKYSVGHGITLLNALMCYTKTTDSNMYLCSMDAEKCFRHYMACRII